MEQTISFLLGAGFSAPMGYPIGNSLGTKLLNSGTQNIAFSTGGNLYIKEPNVNYGPRTSYDNEFDFCCDLMQYYNNTRGGFDYEEFYDFFQDTALKEDGVKALFESKNYGTKNLNSMLSSMENIYTHLVSLYLVDGKGEAWYDDEAHHLGSTFFGYSGILKCIQELGKTHILNIHSLNHDLFFERLNNTEFLAGELCDGFEELGSLYYGNLIHDNRNYMCRLSYYTGQYKSKYRLFKLHGSKDYGIYYNDEASILTPETYIKTRWGIGFGDFFKEARNKAGNLIYERCWINMHSDFLTGTTSKILRYGEPLLFKNLFACFQENLKNAEKLVIIGYGGRDSKVNEMILENFDFKAKSSFIIDPFPGEAIKPLQGKLNAKLITKHLEDIQIEDLLPNF